jgi:hypothetical protein
MTAIHDHLEKTSERSVLDSTLDQEKAETRRVATQSTKLVELATEPGIELFRDPGNTPFARIRIGKHWEVWPIRSMGFRAWLQRSYYEEHRRVANSTAIQDALSALEGKAIYDGHQRDVFVRTGRDAGGTLYIDLGDEDWRVVKVTPERWEVVTESPVAFRRSKTTRPLPYPEAGGHLRELGRFLNLRGGVDGDDFLLVCGFMVAALLPSGPYPILDFAGEQGGGKTTASRVVRRLIDPRQVEVASFPRDDGDLATVAANTHLLAFDNVSHISDENADKLCRLSTGGGFHKRKLYSDDEEHAVDVVRPAILNGIPDLATRPDLADRTLVIELPAFRGKSRLPETLFWLSFEQAAPKLFGALLDALVIALRNLPSTQRDDLPRMADFARLGEAMLPVLDRPQGDFIVAMRANADRQNDVILEAYPDMVAVLKWSNSWDDEKSVTATSLLDLLNEQASTETKKSRSWPKTPKDLSANLRRAAPNLYAAGLKVDFGHNGSTRFIKFSKVHSRTIERSALGASQGGSPTGATNANNGPSTLVSDPEVNPTQPELANNGLNSLRATLPIQAESGINRVSFRKDSQSYSRGNSEGTLCPECGGPMGPHRGYRCEACEAVARSRVDVPA